MATQVSNNDQNKLQSLMIELEKANSLLNIKTQECEQYSLEIKQMKENNTKLLTECQETKQELHDTQITTETLQSELKGLLQDVQSSNDNMDQFDQVLNENIKLKTEKKLLNETLTSIKNDNEIYLKQTNALNQNILNKDKKYNDLNQINSKLKHQILSLKSMIKDKNEEIMAMEQDLTQYENQINQLKSMQISQSTNDQVQNENEPTLFATKRKSIQELFATRLLTQEDIERNQSFTDLREDTPSNVDDRELSPTPTPPHQLYNPVMSSNYSASAQSENNYDAQMKQMSEDEKTKIEQRIRKQVEDAYQEKFDRMVNGQQKYESTFFFFLNVAGLLFIAFAVIIGIMGKDRILCDKCEDCQQGLTDLYIDCNEPPISKLEINMWQ